MNKEKLRKIYIQATEKFFNVILDLDPNDIISYNGKEYKVKEFEFSSNSRNYSFSIIPKKGELK